MTLPEPFRGAKPMDYSEITLADMRKIGRCRSIDELNMRAYFIRRGMRKQASRLGARWDQKLGRYVPRD